MRDDVHIVLDSIAVSEETSLKDDPRCHVVKLIVGVGDEEWIDGDKSLKEMFSLVEKHDKLPKTSQPPVGQFLDLFTKLSQEGKKVIYIAVDSKLSGTYQTACMVAKEVNATVPGADVRVADGRTAGCPLSGMALATLAYAETGASMDEIEQYLFDVIRRTETFFSVETLDYLEKGGRIGAVGALVGNILGIRPIISLEKDGSLFIKDKCRTRKKILNRLIELGAAEAPIEAMYVAHAEAHEDAEYLKAQLLELFPDVPLILTGIGTVLAAHLGPGVIGVFVRKKL